MTGRRCLASRMDKGNQEDLAELMLQQKGSLVEGLSKPFVEDDEGGKCFGV